jgi:hypothetical protein
MGMLRKLCGVHVLIPLHVDHEDGHGHSNLVLTALLSLPFPHPKSLGLLSLTDDLEQIRLILLNL